MTRKMTRITVEEAEDWLNAYGQAWIEGDPSAVVALFHPDAEYRETPFSQGMTGSEAIRRYWQEGAADSQEDVTFTYDIWSVSGNEVHAGWTARFRRKGTGVVVDLDGVFRLIFDQRQGATKCSSLREWWHLRETPRAG